MDKVLVTWLDAKSGGENWQTPEELVKAALQPYLNQSVGWLLYKGRQGVVLAQTLADDELVSDWVMIPKAMIQSLRRLDAQEDHVEKRQAHAGPESRNATGVRSARRQPPRARA